MINPLCHQVWQALTRTGMPCRLIRSHHCHRHHQFLVLRKILLPSWRGDAITTASLHGDVFVYLARLVRKIALEFGGAPSENICRDAELELSLYLKE